MSIKLPEESNFYYLQPGYIYCSPTRATVHTVVGSCVSVCIWDRRLMYGAMNHFLYPTTRDPQKATPVYGNVATAGLVRMMLEGGSQVEDLAAQILGGACPDNSISQPMGLENVRVARQVLERKDIAISSEDTGGVMGRKVAFDTGTGHVMVLKVHRIREDDWTSQDHDADC